MGWSYTLNELAAAAGAVLTGPADAGELRFSGVSTDTRKIKAGEVFFALHGERFDGDQFADEALARGALAAVCTTGSGNGPRLVVRDALAALQAFSVWHRQRLSPRIIGITGSCGKTTTKDFVHAILSSKYKTVKTTGNLNNEIGVPLSLLTLDAETEFAVIEMGANHVGEIKALCAMVRPQESAVTLVAPSHLEGFGSIERIAQAKFEIAEGLGEDGRFYVNTDDPFTVAMGQKYPGDKVYFGNQGDVAIRSVSFDEAGEMMLDIDPVGRLRLPLPVKAHAHNVALSVAMGLKNGVTEFEGPLREAALRSARFKTLHIGPVEVFDDTYNANPRSMAAAIEALGMRPGKGKKIAALGEMLELGPEAAKMHAEVGAAAGRNQVSVLFARGKYAEEMAAAARAAGVELVEVIQDHNAIADAIAAAAAPGDVVLLKGSRGMRMELVLEALRARYGAAETGGRP